MVDEYTIYACTVPGCGYYRDALSSGTHHSWEPDKKHWRGGQDVSHPIAPLVVVPKTDESNGGSRNG